MRHKSVAVCATVLFLGVCLLLWSTPLQAQRASSGPRVVSAVQQDVSRPLRQTAKREREDRPVREMHRHDTHPLTGQSSVSGTDPVLQTSSGPLVATTAGLSFDGIGQGAYGFTVNSAPPDPNGTVGATQFVQWVNTSFAVFNKSNGALLLGPAAGSSFWSGFGGSCETSNDGDPIVQYDKAANRWVVTQPVFTSPYMVCIAVSTTSDATGSYSRYAFPMPNFPDYPKLGVWSDAYYMTFNMFAGGVSFIGADACALDRAKMLTGAPATMQCFQQNSSVDSLLPSDLDGTIAPPAGSPAFFLNFGTNSLNLFKFHVDFTTPGNSTFTGPTNLPVAAFSAACGGGGTCIPQSGTSNQLDSLADRLMYRLAYRNFGSHDSLVVNHSVTAGGGVGVRWYELQNPGSNPVVFQQGTFAPDSGFRWMGSIAMDSAGDIAVGYSNSSSAIHPSIRYTGRVPADILGTMQSENTIINGGGSQTGGLTRWGDYSSISVDPVDDCTFWYTNEYLLASGAFNWSTRIASFKFPNCGTPPVPDFTIAASPSSQTVVQGNGTTYTATVTPINGFTGTVNLTVSGLPAGASGNFNPPSVTSGNSTLSITTLSSTAPGNYPLTITGTSGALVHSAGVTLVVTAAAVPDFSISATPSSRSVVQGVGTTYTATVTPINGFTGTVTLSVSGLPAGASGSFNPPSVTSGNSTLSIATLSSTPTGSFPLTITGTSGSQVHSTQVTLVVTSSNPPDFTISAAPSILNVNRNSSGNYTVTITAVNGFTGTVNLSVSGLGSRVTAKFTPTSVNGSGTSTLRVTVSRRASTGNRTLTIKGTSGSLSHSTNVTLTIH